MRDFPATLVVDEPQVETEVSPQIANWSFADRTRRDVSSELSLQLARPFAMIFSPAYTALRSGRGGLQAFGIGAKYQFVASAEGEYVFSAGLSSIVGGTGSALVGADSYSSVIPTIYFGKGAGELPASLSWLRPLAATGEIAFEVPINHRSRDADFGLGAGSIVTNYVSLRLQGSVQYSLPYLADNSPNTVFPGFFGKVVPLVEYELEIPLVRNGNQGAVAGTVNPGFLLIEEDYHITWGLEALLPINRASGSHPGARLQLSYSFDPPWTLADRSN